MASAAAQNAVFDRLLKRLKTFDKNGTNQVSASDFQRSLKSMSLRFGTPIVDKLMLLCQIQQDGGNVCINRFVEVMEISKGAVQTDEFGLASPRLKSDMRKLSQAERVKRLAKDIHALFYKFDSGNGSMDEFRGNLARLGIEETNETRRLLRQTPISFRALLQSLTHTQTELPGPVAGVQRNNAQSSSINLFGHYDATHMSRKGRGVHEFADHAMHDSDVITWSKRAPKKDGLMHKGAGKFHHDATESHFAIRMDGEDLPVLYTSEVAEMMRETDDHHFETTSQMTSAEALNRSGLPITSAGYHTADQGLLREQIYSCVRQLDQGRLPASGFRERLKTLGVVMPPEAQRLLSMYECNGRVDFTKFVRSFEDYLNVSTVHSALSVPKGPRRSPDPHATRSSNKGHNYNPVAATNHGDIISWHAQNINDEKAPTHHAAIAFNKKLQSLQDSDKNILEWKDEKGRMPRARRSRARGSPHVSNHNDIITWEGSAKPGPIPRAKAVSSIGQTLQSKSCPFGTSSDDHTDVSGIHKVTGSRNAAVGPGRCATGQWFAPPANSAPVHHKRFLRHKGLEDHIGIGCTVQAPHPHHGKKQFEVESQAVDHLAGTAAASSGAGEQMYFQQKKHFGREYARDNVDIAGGYDR